MQIDLLRVLEEKKITRVGNSQPVEVDFRLISATRQDLEKKIADGSFREDFFYRINVIKTEIPPLRDRKEDIPYLIQHAIKLLKQYDWPGNVRELENAIERAVVLSKSRTLEIKDFSFLQPPTVPFSRTRSLLEMEQEHIRQILEECTWNVTKAAGVLNINRVTLHKKIKRYNLKRNP